MNHAAPVRDEAGPSWLHASLDVSRGRREGPVPPEYSRRSEGCPMQVISPSAGQRRAKSTPRRARATVGSDGPSAVRVGWSAFSSTSRMQPIWPALVRIRRCTQALVVVRYSADQGRYRVGPRGSRRGGGRQRRDHSRAETRSGCSRRGSSRAGFERRQVVVAPLLAPFGIARGGGPITGRTAPSRARVDRPRPGKFQIVDAAGPPSDAALAKELSLAAGAGSGNGDGASFAVRLEAPFFDACWSPC